MGYENKLATLTRPAAADLSTKQYYGVKIDSSGKAALAGEGDIAIGILQNAPAALGRAASIAYGGVSKVVGGATVAAGARFSFNSSGLAVGVGSGDDHAMGIVLEDLANGKIGTVLIQPVGTTL
jgi:hypothetical protein